MTKGKTIPCPICGATIEYKTKPPAKCSKCKEAERKLKGRKKRNYTKHGERSKERIMFNVLIPYYRDSFILEMDTIVSY